MKLEEQVCTLPQSKRLKELGVNTESLWYWVYPVNDRVISNQVGVCHKDWANQLMQENEGDWTDLEMAAAYNVAELGVMLPKSLGLNDGHNWSFYHRHCWKGESVGYSAYAVPSIEQDWYKTESEARADMLIRLLEGTLITIEEINKRLTDK